jgi:hypothetical protein
MSDGDNGVILDDIAPGTARRIHLVGVAGTGMGAFAGMLKAAGYVVTAAAVGTASLGLFVLRERRAPHPLVPLHLFRSRAGTG